MYNVVFTTHPHTHTCYVETSGDLDRSGLPYQSSPRLFLPVPAKSVPGRALRRQFGPKPTEIQTRAPHIRSERGRLRVPGVG